MSLFGLLSSGATGLHAQGFGMQVTAQNAQNAGTDGYSRRDVRLGSLPGPPDGGGARGTAAGGSSMERHPLEELYAVIASRKNADPQESYTARLFAKGTGKIAKKLGEEAVETVIAAMKADKAEITSESADLLFHLLVVLRMSDVPLSDVMAELERRTGQSGIAEKASRTAG